MAFSRTQWVAWTASLGLLTASAGVAQTAGALPEAVVLALNVLSPTHARPSTGLVVANGQVLVPAAFVGRGDEIVILDGGTRIDADALPTRTAARSAASGLALVTAEGLGRNTFTLAEQGPTGDAHLTFYAFPPAEELAAGALPVAENIRTLERAGQSVVSEATPLPNIFGALVDRCDRLAGVVIAAGDPSLQRNLGPTVAWAPALQQALRELGVEAKTRRCETGPLNAIGAQAQGQSSAASGPQILDRQLAPSGPDLDVSTARAEPAWAGLALEQTAAEQAPPTPEPALVEGTGPGNGVPMTRSGTGPSPVVSTPHSAWPYAAVGTLLGGLSLGWWLGRRHRSKSPRAQPGQNNHNVHEHISAQQPLADPSTEVSLTFNVSLADGTALTRTLSLHAGCGRLLIGRGLVDLPLDDATLGNVHGRIEWIDGQLAYADTGSDRGSWLNGLACLEDELFFIEEGDQLQLGPVTLVLQRLDPNPRVGP